ncbi:MAG: hypothetical protein RSF40_10660 [Oscillospiraceae bacterium]
MGGETPQYNQVTLKVATDEGLQTRAIATGINRYAIEVYTDANYNTPANVFPNGTNKSINAAGEFEMMIDHTKDYYCLLWADRNSTAVYDITSLKNVTLTGNAAEAWHGTTIIKAGTTGKFTATLHRAVSKIMLLESGKLAVPATATLKLNFDQPAVFNVATKETSAPSARPEETISISANVDGTTTPVVLNPNNDIFVLSSVATANFTDLTFKYNEEAQFKVLQAPLKANFITNIKGHYTSAKSTNFTVTADGEWETPDNNVEFPLKVGDFYYKDKTFSSIYRANAQNPCIGIVFVVNPDGKTGKIVGLTEPKSNWNGGMNITGCQDWGRTTVTTNANDAENGVTNMTTIKGINPTLDTYPAFAWVESQNDTAPAGINWYLPAVKELRQLYAAMSGLKWVASGAGEGEINDWDQGEMPNDYNYVAARTAFNNKFTLTQGTPMNTTLGEPAHYWTSTEYSNDTALQFRFFCGSSTYFNKYSNCKVRAVSAF